MLGVDGNDVGSREVEEEHCKSGSYLTRVNMDYKRK